MKFELVNLNELELEFNLRQWRHTVPTIPHPLFYLKTLLVVLCHQGESHQSIMSTYIFAVTKK